MRANRMPVNIAVSCVPIARPRSPGRALSAMTAM
jgi:hypothetical protein